MPRARKAPIAGILRIRGDDCSQSSSSTERVSYDEDGSLKPEKDCDRRLVKKVRFELPETFHEERCDRDHPRYRSPRAVAVAVKSQALQDLYKGRRKRGAEFLSGFSVAALSAEMLRWSLLQQAADEAAVRSQVAYQWYSEGLLHLRKAKAKASAATHHHFGGHAGWMVFLKSGLMFCPVQSVRSSVQHSARETMKMRSHTSKSSLHAMSVRVHQEAETLHASHLAAIKAKTAAMSAAALVHSSICPVSACLVGACYIYCRTRSAEARSRSVQSDCSSDYTLDKHLIGSDAA
jgi:hypothetical protein